MGYTTKFTGSVSLSRSLTIAEARILLEANEDNEVTADKGATAKKRAGKPLSLSKLAEMALDQVTGG